MAYPDPRTVTPREVLAGLRGIVEREQLDHAGYVSQEVNRELAAAGALCRGHRACAVGSTWLAAGIMPQKTRYESGYSEFSLPGAQLEHGDRLDWLEEQGHDGLRAAYVALCDAAQEYMDERGLKVNPGWTTAGALEGLFESKAWCDVPVYDYLIEPRDMLVVIDRAEELVA